MRLWIHPENKPRLPYAGPSRRLARTGEELQELVLACREGRIADIATWIETGRPLQVEPVEHELRRRKTALSIAIDTGQHDLVHLLLAAGCRPEFEPHPPLSRALARRRWDLVDLLLKAGADPSSAQPYEVFETYERDVMERCWALGVDLAGDGSMASTIDEESDGGVSLCLWAGANPRASVPDLLSASDVPSRIRSESEVRTS